MKKISILGTGWLGLELALSLQNSYKIKVSSRTIDKLSFYEELGLMPYLLNENELKYLPEILDCDYLFINFPPSKFENYLNFLNKIYSQEKITSIKKIIFISSTSIYPKDDGIYKEDYDINIPSSQKVFEAEELIKDKTDVIFRCSGLIGGNRIAGKRLSQKEVKDSNSKINHVHRDDIINATKFVIEKNINGVFNLCAAIHPTKKELYKQNSIKYDFISPIFLNEYTKKRIIDGDKITEYGFKYTYNNPLMFPVLY